MSDELLFETSDDGGFKQALAVARSPQAQAQVRDGFPTLLNPLMPVDMILRRNPILARVERENKGDTRTENQKNKKHPDHVPFDRNKHGVAAGLKRQVGDWNDPARSDYDRSYSAGLAVAVLRRIKNLLDSSGGTRDPRITGSDTIDGFTSSSEARHGTEAGVLQNFARDGYGALNTGHRLPFVDDKSARAAIAKAIDSGTAADLEGTIANLPPGVKVGDQDGHGDTALHYLVGRGKGELLAKARVLVEDGRIDMATLNKNGKSALHLAEEKAGKNPEARELADHLKKTMTEELKQSVLNGDENRSIALLKAGADPKASFGPDLTILMYAAGNRNSNTVEAIVNAIPDRKKREDYVNRVEPKSGNTALHAAAGVHDQRAVDILRRAGAKEIPNRNGNTPDKLLKAPVKRSSGSWKPDETQNFWRNIAYTISIAITAGLNSVPTGVRFDDTPLVRGVRRAPLATGTPEEQARDYADRILAATGQNLPVTMDLASDDPEFHLGPIRIEPSDNPRNQQVQYILNRLRDLATIAATETGRLVLDRIFTGGDAGVVITQVEDNPEVETIITDQGEAVIYMDDTDGDLWATGSPLWSTADQAPTDVTLLHELIHAADYRTGDYHTPRTSIYPNGHELDIDEARTVGLGPWADMEGTVNAYRRERVTERGQPMVRQDFYEDPSEIGSNGRWGNGASLDELMWRPA